MDPFNVKIIIISIICSLVLLYFGYYTWNASNSNIEHLGQRGDFFGGIVNPILSCVTLLGFMYTLFLQRNDLQESRIQSRENLEIIKKQTENMESQSFQSSFFEIVNTYTSIVNNIRSKDPTTKEIKVGKSAFNVMYSNLRRKYRSNQRVHAKVDDINLITASYYTIYRAHQYDLAHYFRFLYNSILYIESEPNHEKYIKLLRSQISNQELIILYYNCAVSKFGLKFKPLAEKHALFDNMPAILLEEKHGELLSQQAFGGRDYSQLMIDSRPPNINLTLYPEGRN